MNEKIAPILLELKQALSEFYQDRLIDIILFGSQARDDATHESDIDVLVILDGAFNPTKEISRTGDIVAGLSLKHNVVIACLFMSAERYRHEQSPLLLNVRREGTPV